MDSKQILKIKVSSMLNSVRAAPRNEQDQHISQHLGENFNALISELKKEFPDLETAFPPPIPLRVRPYFTLGKTSSTYLDLQIFLNQILEVLNAAGRVAGAGPLVFTHIFTNLREHRGGTISKLLISA